MIGFFIGLTVGLTVGFALGAYICYTLLEDFCQTPQGRQWVELLNTKLKSGDIREMEISGKKFYPNSTPLSMPSQLSEDEARQKMFRDIILSHKEVENK